MSEIDKQGEEIDLDAISGEVYQEKLIVKDVKIADVNLTKNMSLKALEIEDNPLDALANRSAEQKHKLDEIELTVSRQNTKKKKVWNIVFFLINIGVVSGILIYQLIGQDWVPPSGLNLYLPVFLVLILVFCLILMVDTAAYAYLLKRSSGKWRFGLCFKMNILGRYYDNVTPMATGGQPFQITYLKKHNVSIENAMSIPLAKMVFQQICYVIVSFICMIVAFNGTSFKSFVSIASIVGFVLTAFVLFVTAFLSMSKKVGKKLLYWALKLLQKLKLLKNFEKHYEKINKSIEDYQDVMRRYAKSPKDLIMMFVLNMFKMLLNYTIPYLVFCLFVGFESEMYFKFFVMGVMIDLAAGFFPLPGGTGMSEISFSMLFGSIAGFAGGRLFWALLIWRFFSYYIYLVSGITLISYDIAYGNRKFKWEQRKGNLVEESKIFKQEQIKRFRAERNKQRKIMSKR